MVGYPAVPELDRVVALDAPTIDDYILANSPYVLDGRKLPVHRTAKSESANAGAVGPLPGVRRVIANELQECHRR